MNHNIHVETVNHVMVIIRFG